MMLFVFALRGYFPRASNRLHKSQDRNLVVADANDQTTILIAMGARKRNGPLAVDHGDAKRNGHLLGWPLNGGGGGTAVPPFRDGLDYAFILLPGCGACYPLARILVRAL